MCFTKQWIDSEKSGERGEQSRSGTKYADRIIACFPLILLAWIFIPEACFAQKKAAKEEFTDVDEEVISESQVVDRRTITVEQTVWTVSDVGTSFGKTVESFVIKDEKGKVHYSKSYEVKPYEGEKGFREEFVVSSGKINTPEKEALILDYGNYPSAPSSGHQKHLFVWRGDELKPLSPPLDVYGQFGDLTLESEDRTIELESDEIILDTRHMAYHFHLIIPVKIDFGNDAASAPYETPIKQDAVSGLDIMQIEVMPRERRKGFMSEKPQQVTLYSSPVGNKATTVTVDRESTIEIGPVYGKASIDKSDYSGSTVNVSHKVKRLKVTIDGTSGFVEEEAYMKLGLPAFG